MTTSGVTSSYTYDPWGRLASRSATIGGQSYTATYTYRFGDKLQRIDSNFPGETPVVLYNYDGLGKRRLKAIGNDTTYWRWDAGYSVLAQYQDTTPDWGISGFDRFFVPFGHTALAEADLDASGVPANAAYTYLAQDHLGTSTHGFNQSKTVVSQNVHLPFGQRSYAYGNSPYHEFTGKPWDAESQMYYFPYRYYSPNMNRWTRTDSCCMPDGPNLYGYVLGNPITLYDSDGREAITVICIGGSIWALVLLAYSVWRPGKKIVDTTTAVYTDYTTAENLLNSSKHEYCSNMSEDQYFTKIQNRKYLLQETTREVNNLGNSYIEYLGYGTSSSSSSCRPSSSRSTTRPNGQSGNKNKKPNITEFNYYYNRSQCPNLN